MAEPVATQKEQVAWYNIIGQFQKKAREFEALFARLRQQRAIAARHPQLASEYSRMISTGQALQNKIVQVRDATNKVVGWLKGFFTFSGIDGMGALPIIPIAVVAASVAAIGKWVSDAYVFSRKLDEVQRLEARGVPVSQAVHQVQRLTPARGSMVGSILGIEPKWLLVGGLALIAVPMVMKFFQQGPKRGG